MGEGQADPLSQLNRIPPSGVYHLEFDALAHCLRATQLSHAPRGPTPKRRRCAAPQRHRQAAFMCRVADSR